MTYQHSIGFSPVVGGVAADIAKEHGYAFTLCFHVNGTGEERFQDVQLTFNQACTLAENLNRETAHVSEAEAVKAQAARIRDLVSETVQLKALLAECREELQSDLDADVLTTQEAIHKVASIVSRINVLFPVRL